MARAGKLRTGSVVALLLAAGCAIVLWEPWHGPIVLSLSTGHGIDTGDLPALPLLALAVAIAFGGTRRGRAAPQGRLSHGLRGPASAVVLGVLLLLAGMALAYEDGGPLVPAGGGTFDGSTQHATAHRADPVDRWTHVAVTYDGAVLRLYVDGTRVSRQPTTGTLPRTSDPLWIGGNHPYGEYFDGLIDEVRVYHRGLSPSAVRAEMSTPIRAGSPEKDLVGAYAFDRNSPTVAADASGNRNTGAITGAAWTPEGRFGGALRFDGAHAAVRIPGSRSLDLSRAMTLSAWVRPSESQAGWRTILHRQTDVYYLAAGTDRAARAVAFDDARALLLVAVAVWLAVMLAAGHTGWLGERQRSWWPPVALFVAGSIVDAALAPSGTLAGPTLVAVWCGVTSPRRREAVLFYVLAAAFTAATVASLAGPDDLELSSDGSVARSAALGLVLVTLGLLGARRPAAARP